jgi:hypothetical protein
MAMSMGLGLGVDGLRYELQPEAMERLCIEPAVFEQIMSQYPDAFTSYIEMFNSLEA